MIPEVSQFTKENRYLVFKRKDVDKYLNYEQQESLNFIAFQINLGRTIDERLSLKCVVVESDWPEYEQTWAAIKQRVESN